MDQENDELRKDLAQTRQALDEKIALLKEKVSASVNNVTQRFEDGVEKVTQTVEDTIDSVKNTFNISQQVQNHPVAMVALSVGAGMFLASKIGSAPVKAASRSKSGAIASLLLSPSPLQSAVIGMVASLVSGFIRNSDATAPTITVPARRRHSPQKGLIRNDPDAYYEDGNAHIKH